MTSEEHGRETARLKAAVSIAKIFLMKANCPTSQAQRTVLLKMAEKALKEHRNKPPFKGAGSE